MERNDEWVLYLLSLKRRVLFWTRIFKPLIEPVYIVYIGIALGISFFILKALIMTVFNNQMVLRIVLFLMFFITAYILAWRPWQKAIQGFWRTPYWLHPTDLIYIRLFPVSFNKYLRIDNTIRYLWACSYIIVWTLVWLYTLRLFEMTVSSIQIIFCMICWLLSRICADLAGQLNFKHSIDIHSVICRLLFVIPMCFGSAIPFLIVLLHSDAWILGLMSFLSFTFTISGIWLMKTFPKGNATVLARVIEDANYKRAKILARILRVDFQKSKSVPKWRIKIPLPQGGWNFGWRYIRLAVRIPGCFRHQTWLFTLVLGMSSGLSSSYFITLTPDVSVAEGSISRMIGLLLAFVAGTLVSSIIYALNWKGDLLSAPWLTLFPMQNKTLIDYLKKGPTLFAEVSGILYWGISVIFLYHTFGSHLFTRVFVILVGTVVSWLLVRQVIHETIRRVLNPNRIVSPFVITSVGWGYVAFIMSHQDWVATMVSWAIFLCVLECVQIYGRIAFENLYRKFLNNL